MKRITALALTLALAISLAACSNSSTTTPDETITDGTSTETQVETDTDTETDTESETAGKDYAAIIAEARDAEYNEYYMIISPSEDGEGYEAIEGYSADYEPEYLKEDVDNFIGPMLGFDLSLAEDYAFSLSVMMTQSYGIAIVKPAEGNTDAIVAGLEAFVAQQRSSFENYLPDQYEIASAATVTVAASGEVILVCGENSAEELAAIEAALKA